MLVVGDRVKIIDYPEKKYVERKGEVLNVRRGVKLVSQPVIEKLPKLESEDGKALYSIREQQIQKL